MQDIEMLESSKLIIIIIIKKHLHVIIIIIHYTLSNQKNCGNRIQAILFIQFNNRIEE